MKRWQRSARWCLAVFGVVFAVFVAREMKRRDGATGAGKPVVPTDPGGVVATTAGQHHTYRKRSRRRDLRRTTDLRRRHQQDAGVHIVFDENERHRTFTITGKEGKLGKGRRRWSLDGAVRLVGLRRHDGPDRARHLRGIRRRRPRAWSVEMTKGRQHATGIGMIWEKTPDILTILDQAVVHVGPENRAMVIQT